MRTRIEVTAAGGDRYTVTVADPESQSLHEVIANSTHVADWADGHSGEELVAASFRFLLDREPKESIMRRFELPVILRYFPEYPDRIGDYL